MMDIFEEMFDFNHDGELDTFEKAMELEFWEELGRENVTGVDDAMDESDW